MTKVVDVHVFDKHVQSKIKEKYNHIDFNGDFNTEYEKWIDFVKLITQNLKSKKKLKIFEMMNQLKLYSDNTYITNTDVKVATLFQVLISKMQKYYLTDKTKFDVLFGYFEEFYSEELSTHCVEGVSNRAFFILELANDYGI